jgi:hypothetical protein
MSTARNFKLSLWRRTNRENAQGIAAISLRVTINEIRTELATDVSCPAAYWPRGAKYLVLPTDPTQWVAPDYLAEDVARLNEKLHQFKRSIEDLYKRLRQPEAGGPFVEVSADELHKVVRGGESKAATKARELRRPLLDIARAFVDALQDVPRADRLADSTLQNYECRFKTLKRYLDYLGTKNLPAAEVDIPWCRRYERWLLTPEGGFSSAPMRKQVNFLQLALNYAVAEGWLPTKTLHGYKYQTRATIPLALSLPADEVAQLVTALPDLGYSEERAVAGWLFCCYTGLSWVDYCHFCASPSSYLFTEQPANRTQTPTYWVRMVRQKMRRRKPQGFSVPLFEEAAELLRQWEGQLPWIANANKILHAVEEELGLSQSLTTKLARATFSQRKRDEGYSDEAVAAMMGDSVAVMNRHYSKVSERRLVLEMEKLGAITRTTLQSSTPDNTPHFAVITGPSCTAVAQALPIVPHRADTRRRQAAITSKWKRPAPVTSHDNSAHKPGPRVVPMWAAEPATPVRKEAASA